MKHPLENILSPVLKIFLFAGISILIISLVIDAPVAFWGASTNILVCLIVMYLLKRIQINLIGWIISGSLLLTSIFAQYVGAGIHDVATLFIPITLGIAGLMMNKNHFVFFSIIAVLMETSISYMQINSLTSGIVSETAEVVDYFVPPILFFSFSILLYFAAFQYRAALEDTESAMRRYRDIFSSTKDGIIITSLDGYILDSNNSLAINIGIEKSLDYIQDLPNWNREIHLQIGDQKEVQFDWIYSSGKEGLTNNKIIYVRANQIKIRDTQQIIWIFQDVTKARQLTELSHQADKIRAIGQLASGIAHDFNNQTAGMVGMVERLNTYCKDIPEASEYLNQILYKHYHAGEQISQLLSLGKPQVRNKTAVNIYEIVKQSSTFLNQNYDQHIEFIFNLKTEQTTIFANRSQIENIVLNLLLNARDSMSDGGTITIDIKENNRDHVPGIQLLITDTGLGMDDESIRCAFEPFYTTRDEGTGLGLFMVYTNIEAHNGHIELQSKIGEGTTVNIWLPTELSFPVDNLAPKSASVNTLKKHILLIEDNLTIAESTEIQLSHRGYTVGCAYSGSEAIEYCKNHLDLHCILLDVMLPDTTGDILFPTLKDLHPQTPIIVISGFASKSVIDNLINAGASAFISKPYRFSTLDTQIQSLISK